MLRHSWRLLEEAGDGTGGTAPPPAPGPDDWKSTIDAEFQDTALVKETKSVADLAKRAVHADRLLSNSIRIPSENAGDEDRAAFRAKLRERVPGLVEFDQGDPASLRNLQRSIGLPEAPEGYATPEITAPDGVSVSMHQADAFRPVAHKYGLTQEQYAGVVQDISATNIATARAELAVRQENVQALKDEWGNAYDQKTQQALAAARATRAPEALINAIQDGKAGADTMRWMAKVHDSLGKQALEGVGSGDGGAGGPDELTPSEAMRQKIEIQNNKDHPYWHQADPNHQWAVGEYRRLTKAAMGKGHADNALMATVGNDDDRPVINFEGSV